MQYLLKRVSLYCWVLGLCLPLCLVSQSNPPSSTALQVLEHVTASEMGTDRVGNLWTWNFRNGGWLRILTPAGQWLHTVRFPDIRYVDFDSEWGLVAVGLDQQALWVKRKPDEGELFIGPLGGPVGAVAWLGENRLALSPRRSPERIWIYDLNEKAIVDRWGEEDAIPATGTGHFVLRDVFLEVDFARGRLWSIDSLSGTIMVYDFQGQVLLHERFLHPKLDELKPMLDQMDQQQKEQGERLESSFELWSFPTLDPEGNAWWVERCDKERGTAQLRKLAVQGQVHAVSLHEVATSCCALSHSAWDENFLFFVPAGFPHSQLCVSAVPFEQLEQGIADPSQQ